MGWVGWRNLRGFKPLPISFPSALEFAYAEAPRSMKGAVMGLFFLTAGLGSLLGWGLQTLLSLPTHGWTHCPKDHGEFWGHGCHLLLDMAVS